MSERVSMRASALLNPRDSGDAPALTLGGDEHLEPPKTGNNGPGVPQFDPSLLAEAWRVEYTPLTRNLVKNRSVLATLQNAMRPYEASAAYKAEDDHVSSHHAEPQALPAIQSASGKWIVPVVGVRQRSKLGPDGPSAKSTATAAALEEEGTPDSDRFPPDAASSAFQKRFADYNTTAADAIGLTAVGNECVPVSIAARATSLSQLNLRTYVKQISDTAAAGIFTNVLQIVPLPSEPQRPWSASRVFSRPVMHGLFSEQYIPAGSFITEFKGELSSADDYRSDPRNMYDLAGCTKPHVHLFPPPLNLAIDARRFGSEARFARYSCHPNAVLRPILFSKVETDENGIETQHEPELLFGLFAIGDISKMHEITVGWEWDDLHIVHLLPQLVDNPLLDSNNDISRAGRSTAAQQAARQAALVALADRGDFPYAATLFSAKMNAATAAVLGTVLCACIGSASAPTGNISASSNNGKKQDCAVAQMLRVSQGMALLNVQMPGKSNRKGKLPDFKPLVGVKRWWRPLALPPTPESSRSDPFDARAVVGDELMADAQDVDEREEDAKSEATAPLSGMSEDEDSASDVGEDTLDAKTDREMPSILPPKKRVSGTRIKASYSDNEENEADHRAAREKLISAASAGASHTRGKRKAKHQELGFPLEEVAQQIRKKQRRGAMPRRNVGRSTDLRLSLRSHPATRTKSRMAARSRTKMKAVARSFPCRKTAPSSRRGRRASPKASEMPRTRRRASSSRSARQLKLRRLAKCSCAWRRTSLVQRPRTNPVKRKARTRARRTNKSVRGWRKSNSARSGKQQRSELRRLRPGRLPLQRSAPSR